MGLAPAPARVRGRLSRERPTSRRGCRRSCRSRRRGRRGSVLLHRCSRAQATARVRGPGTAAARPRRARLEGAHRHRQAGRCGARASPGELDNEEIAEWLESHRDELAELGPGHHELAAIDDGGEPGCAAGAARGRQGPPDANTPRPGTRSAGAVRRAVLPRLRAVEHWQHLSAPARAATVDVLDQQASRIAGHRADVICDVAGPPRRVRPGRRRSGGGRRPPRLADTAGLLPALSDPPTTAAPTARASGRAIAVLAHEAWHLHGESSEALANCFAYQSGVGVGEALGLSSSTARQLMREQLADNPSDYAETPAYIVPPGCRRAAASTCTSTALLPLRRCESRERRSQSVAFTTAVATTSRLSRKSSSRSAAASPSAP